MSKFRIPRRTFLRGLGSAGVALPFLEIMMPEKASAAPTPTRFGLFFDGQSLGADGDTRNYHTPTNTGLNYTPSVALQPLETLGVKTDVSVVTGLKIFVSSNAASAPGERVADFHARAFYPQINGMRTTAGPGAVGDRPVYIGEGNSVDKKIAAVIGQTTIHRSLHYQGQAAWYLTGGSSQYGRDVISFTYSGSTFNPQVNEVSPFAAWRSLFMNFTPPNPADQSKLQLELAKRKSILDIVSGDMLKIMKKLGRTDKQRLNQHYDEIRDLERRLAAVPPPPSGQCFVEHQNTPDPTVGGGRNPNATAEYASNEGYSNEDWRIARFCDFIYMAYVCDLTRVATLQMTTSQSHMAVHSLPSAIVGDVANIKLDQHELGHSAAHPMGKSYAMAKVISWHVHHYGRLVKRLKDAKEGNGSVLDNCALVFLNEGGHGTDPSTGNVTSSHSTDNMAVMVAGRAGGLKPQGHLVQKDVHPAKVVASAMNAVGVSGNLGEVQGYVPALFGPAS